MIFVDAGYLLALVKPRDQTHGRAMNWAKVTPGPLITTEYVLWEMFNGLSKSGDREKSHALYKEIRNSCDWKVVAAANDLLLGARCCISRMRTRSGRSLIASRSWSCESAA